MNTFTILVIIMILLLILLVIAYLIFLKSLGENKVYPNKRNCDNNINDLRSAASTIIKDTNNMNIEPGNVSVIMVKSGQNKISVIKEIRLITGLGLKESKDLADKANSTIISNVSLNTAEELKVRLSLLGAIINIIED